MKKIDNLKKLLSSNKILILILILSFAVSLAYSFYFKIEPSVDARAYDKIAMNLVEGNGYRENLSVDIKHDYAIARVGPLYQYFLAGIYKIFGHHYEAVWIIQAILHALSAYLIYLTSLLIFFKFKDKRTISLWAAGIFGLYPDLIEISAMIMTETLYLFLTSLMLYIFFLYFNKKDIWLLAVFGLMFGLATLARPPILFFIPIIFFYFYKKKQLLQSVIFSLIVIAVFLPWTIRNYAVYDKFMPFGAAGAMNFWIGNYHGGDGEQAANQDYLNFLTSHNIIATADESIRQFKIFLYEYPVEFFKLTFLRINKYFSMIRPMGFWFYQSGWSQFLFLCSSGLASAVLFIFSLGGIIKSINLKNEAIYYLIAFTLVTPIILFITVVETRYRFQIYPLLAIFSGYFIILLKNSRTRWWLNKMLWLSISLFLLNSLVDLFLSIERFKERIGWFF